MKDNFLPLSILGAAIIIGGSLIYTTGARVGIPSQAALTDTLGEAIPTNTAPSVSNISIDDDVILGDPNAPVTMIVFGDYQCPFCLRATEGAEAQIRDTYVADGKVRMIYRDFPLDQIHPFARKAAEAAECARDQGKYWMYHDALFERQDEIGKLDYTTLAGELGLNTRTFGECVASEKYQKEVEKDYQDGIAAGVRGTPATFINGKMISGALPFEAFQTEIETALSNL
jgi:protein-disulfide isomerase